MENLTKITLQKIDNFLKSKKCCQLNVFFLFEKENTSKYLRINIKHLNFFQTRNNLNRYNFIHNFTKSSAFFIIVIQFSRFLIACQNIVIKIELTFMSLPTEL